MLSKHQPSAFVASQSIHSFLVRTRREYSVEYAVFGGFKQEEFRVLAVCQFLPVQGRSLSLAKNQLIFYLNIFLETPISSLNVTLIGSNAFLFGKELTAIKTIVTETDKLNWIVPLVFMVDSRVLSMADARHLSKLTSLDDMRAETVQLLSTQICQLPLNLNNQTGQLTTILSHLCSRSTV
uniref:Large ribosomal subunit protein uL10m n=1 Tax=Heterorhabditis bacteriophora TaxID=37862 RepID=A0A1I7X236_HETBA